ncbi:MAG TPA: signal peptidase I [Candidatus Peribacterales bacterium]|nr:signal peptidase I [Candidatus Peribacterales bacterium]
MRWNREKIGSEHPYRSALHNIFDVLLNVVIIVAIVAIIRTFIVSPYQVEGNSMIPSLEDKQYIIINKIGYIVGEPRRGDVVVFRPPSDSSKYYVKRIIGIPGDEIAIRNGKVFLVIENEEHELSEEYLDELNANRTFRAPVGSGDRAEDRYIVPEDNYFLLGDNRQGSLDSRSFRNEIGEPIPYVDREYIAGRVWFIALPITKSHALETPDYGVDVQE